MRNKYAAALLAAGLMASAGRAHAAPTLSLSSSSDLDNLEVGQTVRIDVRLSDLGGSQLELLATGVAFDRDILGSATTPAAGAIVPNASDPMSFQPSTDPGFVDVIFEAVGDARTDRITDNGQFFSFELTAQEIGSGEIAFDFADALAFNEDDPFMPLQPEVDLGASLGVTVVPLPPALIAGLVGIGGVVAGQVLRARRSISARA